MKNDVQTGPSKDLGGFAPETFEKINEKGGGFEGQSAPRAVGASEIPVAGEKDADAALAKLGPLSRGRIDKTSSASVKLPVEAGGPLPQGTEQYRTARNP